jgi:hypothetical protein
VTFSLSPPTSNRAVKSIFPLMIPTEIIRSRSGEPGRSFIYFAEVQGIEALGNFANRNVNDGLRTFSPDLRCDSSWHQAGSAKSAGASAPASSARFIVLPMGNLALR